MRYTTLVCVLVFLLAGSSSVNAQAPGKVYLRASFGISTQSLSDVNSAIEDDERVFQDLGVPVNFETFGGVLDIAGELGVWINRTVSLGIGMSHQKNTVDQLYSDISGSYSDQLDLRIIDVTGSLAFWTATSPSWFFGADAGVGFGSADESLAFNDFIDPANSFSMDGEWDGNGFVGGVFAGLQYDFPSGPLLFGKIGYHYRNLGEFEGNVSMGSTTVQRPPQDNAGQPLDFDFSGIYARVGLGFSFGG